MRLEKFFSIEVFSDALLRKKKLFCDSYAFDVLT